MGQLLIVVNFLKCVVTEVPFSILAYNIDISQGSVATHFEVWWDL